MKLYMTLFFALNLLAASAQLPTTNIYVADLILKGNDYNIANIREITNRTGYDNQPFFSNDGNFIFFTSDRDGAQTDIYKYDIKKKNIERITQTQESEYSPALVAGMDALSVVRVNKDSAQQLYRMLPDGSNPVILYTGNDTIGYYAWLDPVRVLIYALGEKNTLRLLDLNDQKSYLITDNIGRNIQRIANENAVSFTVKSDSENWQLKKFDGILNKVEAIINLPAGAEDYAWLNATTLVSGANGKLYYININKKETGWILIGDLSNTAVANFYRMSVDPSGTKIAFVVRPQAAE